jgi:uncharacterized protein (DUF1684 family)
MESPSEAGASDRLALLDWKRRVFELYARIRASDDPEAAWREWRQARDELFSGHPSTPIPPGELAAFAGLAYFDYDPRLRVLVGLSECPPGRIEIGTSDAGTVGGERFARAEFELGGQPQSLDLYWLAGYGGGLLVAFADATSGAETYGGGRYLLDTIKGADLGALGERLVLDFNFAYHPSCCYDPRWSCPLAPRSNRLSVAVRGGERLSR